MKNDKYDKRIVTEFFENRGFDVQGFSKDEMKTGKTPDFKVKKNQELAFYCELKSIAPFLWPRGFLLFIQVKNDPTYNTLTDKICGAIKQFDAVNPDREFTNVLVFVNHNIFIHHYDDLKKLLDDRDRTLSQIFAQFRTRVSSVKHKIDGYIWLDRCKNKKPEDFIIHTRGFTHSTEFSTYFPLSNDV